MKSRNSNRAYLVSFCLEALSLLYLIAGPLRLARYLWQLLDTSSTRIGITVKFFLDLSISRGHILGLS